MYRPIRSLFTHRLLNFTIGILIIALTLLISYTAAFDVRQTSPDIRSFTQISHQLLPAERFESDLVNARVMSSIDISQVGLISSYKGVSPVTNLTNSSYSPIYIKWIWKDPSSKDFSHVMIYLNGIYKGNVSKGIQAYTATGLFSSRVYTIKMRTIDKAGRPSTWVNHTARTAPPPEKNPPASVTDLCNSSWEQTSITWTWKRPSDPDLKGTWVRVDGRGVAILSQSVTRWTAKGFNPGTSHTIGLRTFDIYGNMNQTWISHTVVTAKESSPDIEGVQIFPNDHYWNVKINHLPVDARSADYVQNIGAGSYMHADFGSGLWEGSPIGIPYCIVSRADPKKPVSFEYEDESDKGPYPIPDDPPIEGGSDHHILIIDKDAKMLYELYAAEEQSDGSWNAGSGAIYNLSGYKLRPAGWTSADAAGLPILPGLVRYDEVASGSIKHAIRFTAPSTQRAYLWPARHYASSITDPGYPPMGQRFRLKSSFNSSSYPYQARVVLNALKTYGMVLADNGGAWYISGVPDERWDNDQLHTLHNLKGNDFEAVDTKSLMINPDSGQAKIL